MFHPASPHPPHHLLLLAQHCLLLLHHRGLLRDLLQPEARRVGGGQRQAGQQQEDTHFEEYHGRFLDIHFLSTLSFRYCEMQVRQMQKKSWERSLFQQERLFYFLFC